MESIWFYAIWILKQCTEGDILSSMENWYITVIAARDFEESWNHSGWKRDGDSTSALGSCARSDNAFGEEIFPNSQPKLPLMQTEAISSCPDVCDLGEDINPHLATPSCNFNLQVKRKGAIYWGNIYWPGQNLLKAEKDRTPLMLCCEQFDYFPHVLCSFLFSTPRLFKAG